MSPITSDPGRSTWPKYARNLVPERASVEILSHPPRALEEARYDAAIEAQRDSDLSLSILHLLSDETNGDPP